MPSTHSPDALNTSVLSDQSHDLARTRNSWRAMRARCGNPKNGGFALYGARGISVCERWASFEPFLQDMGLRPSGTTLDRFPNGAGNYEPGNCRWATNRQQAQNTTRCAGLIEFNGKSQSINEWTIELGLGVNTLHRRLRAGWSIERALTEGAPEGAAMPKLLCFSGRTMSMRAWARELGLGKNVIPRRLARGLPIDQVLIEAGRAA